MARVTQWVGRCWGSSPVQVKLAGVVLLGALFGAGLGLVLLPESPGKEGASPVRPRPSRELREYDSWMSELLEVPEPESLCRVDSDAGAQRIRALDEQGRLAGTEPARLLLLIRELGELIPCRSGTSGQQALLEQRTQLLTRFRQQVRSRLFRCMLSQERRSEEEKAQLSLELEALFAHASPEQKSKLASFLQGKSWPAGAKRISSASALRASP